MAIVKKTLQNLKPGKQYLLTVRAKDADLNNTLDPSAAIRFTVPTDQVQPTSLGDLQISVGYKTAMVSFNPADDLNLKNYEYKVYRESQVQQVGLHYTPISEDDYEVQGFSSSNVFTVNLQETSSIDAGTQETDITTGTTAISFIETKVFYFVKVRSITTSGVASSWTPLQKSGQIPFIEAAHIKELSASQIKSGFIGAETIVLTGADSILKSSSYTPEKSDLIATLTAGTKTVTLTQGTTQGLYPGMYFFIPGLNLATPNSYGPGRFGSNSKIDTIVDSTHFTVTVNHSISGLTKFTSYAKGWNITGDGHVNFGGIQGITFDGTTVRIGADAIIDPGAALPEANIFSVTSGPQSLVIGNRSGFIGLKISDTGSGNVNNNYWYVDGSFKVGTATKYISYDGINALNISGEVTIGGADASTVVSNAATGAENPATRINSNSTTIKGGLIRTGAIQSTGFSWNESSTYSAAGTRLDLDNGQIVSKNFRIDGSGNASFSGNISGSTITGSIVSGGRVEAGSGNFKAYVGDLSNVGGGHYGIALSSNGDPAGDFSNIFLKRNDGAVFFRVDTGNDQYIKFENGTLNIKTSGLELLNGAAKFSGRLEGASGYVTTDFVIGSNCQIGDKLRINEPQSNDNAVVKIRGYGTTSGTQALVVEDSTTANTFIIRDNGAVEIKTSLTIAGKSHTDHTHSYLPLSGGTLTGNLVSQGTTYTRELNITTGYNINASAINIAAGYDINASGTGSVITGATVNGTNMQVGYMTLTGGWGVKSDWSPNADNSYDLGQDNTSLTSTTATTAADKRWKRLYSNNTSISISDIRLKKDIEDASLGLDFIEALRPVSYKFIVGSNEIEKDQNGNPIIIGTDEKGGEIYKLKPIPGVRRHWGFIAQEVKQVIDQSGVEDFAGWSMSNINDPDSKQSLSYEQFISPLVKAVQELSQKVKELELKIQS